MRNKVLVAYHFGIMCYPSFKGYSNKGALTVDKNPKSSLTYYITLS
jgi:hypothetical protein